MIESLASAASAVGLVLRGTFHPEPGDGVPDLAPGTPARSVVLLGWTGRAGHGVFAASPEATDGAAHPLDRWSRRVVGDLAAASGARPLYPFGGPPFLPFQRWAARAEPLFPSPLGLVIHPHWGLWHSYRGALAFAARLGSDRQPPAPSPCASCENRPCLSACPVGAFTDAGYDVAACAGHLHAPAGRECRERGCLARRACPVGPEHAYGPAQAAFHIAAFMAAHP